MIKTDGHNRFGIVMAAIVVVSVVMLGVIRIILFPNSWWKIFLVTVVVGLSLFQIECFIYDKDMLTHFGGTLKCEPDKQFERRFYVAIYALLLSGCLFFLVVGKMPLQPG